jgi:hypothetical protein
MIVSRDGPAAAPVCRVPAAAPEGGADQAEFRSSLSMLLLSTAAALPNIPLLWKFWTPSGAKFGHGAMQLSSIKNVLTAGLELLERTKVPALITGSDGCLQCKTYQIPTEASKCSWLFKKAQISCKGCFKHCEQQQIPRAYLPQGLGACIHSNDPAHVRRASLPGAVCLV